MYIINKATTGIPQIDFSIDNYIKYLAFINVLPNGDYALAGGSIRSILDKSELKDLDIYILGDEAHHNQIISSLEEKAFQTLPIRFCNPFAFFKMLNIRPEKVKHFNRDIITEKEEEKDPFSLDDFDNSINHLLNGVNGFFKAPIQLISFCYDSHYYERIPTEVKKDERFSDTYVSSLEEVVNSFDLTISKGGIHFTITDTSIIVNTITIPHDCLIDICTKTLRLTNSDGVVPQQLCGIKRFHKFIKLGYDADEIFYNTWRERFNHNPHVLGISYD